MGVKISFSKINSNSFNSENSINEEGENEVNKNTIDEMEKLKKIKNGTDIRGIAIENPQYKVNLTHETVSLIGSGFVNWLKIKEGNKKIKIAVGMDSRLSGPQLKEALIDTVINIGCNVYDCGIATTPAMFMTTVLEKYKCHGAIMITASHLPYYYNGLKFFSSVGGCESKDIEEIIYLSYQSDIFDKLEATDNTESLNQKGKLEKADLIDDYSKVLIDKVRRTVKSENNYERPLDGNKIIVDAGNGAGGFFANKVLKELGADIEGSQFLEPDGNFPNHIPNPENKEAMESIREAVLKNNADLGIIFDTDVDRAAIVSSNGEEINKSSLIALISNIVLDETPKSTIVTDSITSTGLSEFIKNLGGVHHRFKRGYKNVINEAKRLNEEGQETYLAIETSGHAALMENYFLDDGAYLIVKILIKMAKLSDEGKDICSLIETLRVPLESKEIRIKINKSDFREYGNNIIEDFKEYSNFIDRWSIEPKNYEGIRINCEEEKGWLLLRLSLHEPLLVLNVESNVNKGIEKILKKFSTFIKTYENLDKKDL